MTKQSKKIYSSLINRIALVLLVNQGLLLALSTVTSLLEATLVALNGDSVFLDMIFRLAECVVYFVSFVIPMNIFNKMNKNAEKEIYEPQKSEKSSAIQSIFMLGIGLGATSIAVYLNYYAVNAFWNYSEFSDEYLWSAELDNPYQIIIYFIYCAIIPAFVEELLFRGTIAKSLLVYGKKTAVVLSALLFALMHSNIEQLLYTFIAGLFLAWIYVETQNVIYPIILHFINNAISTAGDVIYEKCALEIYNLYSDVSLIFVFAFMGISIIGLILCKKQKGNIFDKTVMKPDENGETVLPLTAKEKVAGFFTVRMTMFTLYSILMMIYYIYLSTQLI